MRSIHPPIVVSEEAARVNEQAVEALTLGLLRVRSHLGAHFCALQEGEELDLSVGEVGMPDVEHEDDPCRVAVVPRLVLEGVVENERTARFRLVHVVGHAHARARHAHQRQVDPQLLVRRAVVLDDVCAWCEGREEGVLVGTGHGGEQLARPGTQRAVALEGHLMEREVEHIPIACVVAQLPMPVRRVHRVLRCPCRNAEWLESLLPAKCKQLACNELAACLDVGQPGEERTVPNGLRCQIRQQLRAARLPRRCGWCAQPPIQQHQDPRSQPSKLAQ
mmetsp:Transcript_13880/g.35988  ORF Transcript_13880/g.35988 Transcript_13880/m.35988 type:complete len:277 (-) Transcript_13880:312-1142(-)